MKLIEDIEICKNLIDKRKDYASNCFFLLGQMKELVERQKLFYQEEGADNFLLLCRELSFYRVYYFIKNPEKLCRLKLDRPAVIEFPFRNKLAVAQETQIQMIEKMGFHLERESGRMNLKAVEVNSGNRAFRFSDLKIAYASLEDISEICQLFKERFNELFAFLLSEEELSEHIKENWVIAAYYDGRIMGAFNFTVKGNIAEGGQLAIKNIGSGVGWLLLDKWHELYKGKVKSFRIWVDLANSKAISMYRKAGYEYDGSYANEYVCRPDV